MSTFLSSKAPRLGIGDVLSKNHHPIESVLSSQTIVGSFMLYMRLQPYLFFLFFFFNFLNDFITSKCASGYGDMIMKHGC